MIIGIVTSGIIIVIILVVIIYLIHSKNVEEATKIKNQKIDYWQTEIGNKYFFILNNSAILYSCSNTIVKKARENPNEYVYKYLYKDKSYNEQQRLQRFILFTDSDIQTTYAKAIELKNKLQNELNNTFLPNGKPISNYISTDWYIPAPKKACIIFSYTSPAGRSHNETILSCSHSMIDYIENKEEWKNSAKGQRALMTPKLRQEILERDNYTCKICGNSTYKEPNLLLEVDHIIPVSKGGKTVKENLQTLCWKCNRTKSDKIE